MQKPPFVVKVDLKLDCPCGQAKRAEKLLESGYVSITQTAPPRIVAAVIDCRQSFQPLHDEIKKRHKGNFLREAKKASHKYSVATFKPSDLADRIEEINKSRPVRCGGPMRSAYDRSADELRFDYRNEPRCDCRDHWSVWWGVFTSDDTNGLVGYINLKRYGELSFYALILGHGDRMGDGIMPFLHLEIMKYLTATRFRAYLDTENKYQIDTENGIKWLMYAGYYDGIGKGLNLWKRKAGFSPAWLFNK